MKPLKYTLRIFIAFSIFILCSCIQEQHFVKYTNNSYEIQLSLSLPDSAILSYNEQNGGDLVKDQTADIQKDFGKNIFIKEIKENSRTTLEISFNATKGNRSAKKFLPKKKGNDIIIPLNFSESYDKDLEKNLSQGNVEYTLIVEKSILPVIKEAKLRRKNGNTGSVKFTESKNAYTFKFPMKWLYTKNPFVEIFLVPGKDDDVCKDSTWEHNGIKVDGYTCHKQFNEAEAETVCRFGDDYFTGFYNKINGDALLHFGFIKDEQPDFICVPKTFKCPRGYFKSSAYGGKGDHYTFCSELPDQALANEENFSCKRGFSKFDYTPSCTEYCSTFSGCQKSCRSNEIFVADTNQASPINGACVKIPENSHKVAIKNENYNINEYAYECNSGYYRESDKDECKPWPKGAVKSEKCWVIEPKKLEKYNGYPIIGNDTIVTQICFEEDCAPSNLKDPRLHKFVRGEVNSYLKIKRFCLPSEENCDADKHLSLIREKSETDLTPEKDYLGPWSGCWKCPEETVYDKNSNSCFSLASTNSLGVDTTSVKDGE